MGSMCSVLFHTRLSNINVGVHFVRAPFNGFLLTAFCFARKPHDADFAEEQVAAFGTARFFSFFSCINVASMQR